MKLLITSVGRRVELVQAFHNAAEKIGIELTVIGADITDTAPAMFFCDENLIVPRISDENYITCLIDYCSTNEVDALIPTIDTDLLLLAENKNRFENTKVIISDVDMIRISRDKRFTAEFINSIGLKSPATVDDYLEYEGGYPAFIKPKDGSSSLYAYKVNSAEELEAYAKRVPNYIIQPFIEGNEYTVDVFCDMESNPILITPRIRLLVRAGEVNKTEISQDEKIIREIKQLVAEHKPVGQITVQLIRDNITTEILQ